VERGALMAEFEPPPPLPPELRAEQDPPRRDVPYTPPERSFYVAPRADLSAFIPRIASIVVLAVLVIGYVLTAQRFERPAGFPYSMIVLLALAFVQWMPVQRTQNGKIVIALISIGGALVWLGASLFHF